MTEQNGTLSYPVDRIDELLDKIAKLDITTLLGCEFEGNTRWYASGEDVVIGQVEDHTYASVKIPVKEGMRFSVDVDSSIFGLPSWYTTDAKGVVINVGNTIYANSATSINIEEGAEAYLYVNNYIGNDYNPQVLLYYSIGQILDILGEKPDTKDVVTELNKKVNKVDGKGLSTNDYDDTAKRLVNIVKEGRIYMGVAKHNTTPHEGFEQGGWRFYLAVGHATQPFSDFGLGMLDPHKLYAIINTGGTWHDIEIGSFATPEDIASIEERVPVEISNAISSLMPIYQVVELSDTNRSIELPEGDLEVHYESFSNGDKTGEGVLVPGTTAITHGTITYTDTTISIDGSVNVTATITIYRKTADALQRASSMTDVLHKPFTFPHHMGYYVMNVDTRILPDITSKRSAKCTIVKMMAGVKYRAIPDFKDEESSCQAGLFDESFGYRIMYPISAEEGSRVFEWQNNKSAPYLVVNGTVVIDNMEEVIANGIFNDLSAVDAYADHQAALARYLAQQGLNDKVDKVEGKQLSTEDFTTAMKNKLNQAVTTNQLNQRLEALNNTYAKKVGTEPDLIAGYAEKLAGTAVGGGYNPGSNGVVSDRIGTTDGTLSNFLADIGLGCYLVKDNHNRKKLVKTNHSKRVFGSMERDVSLDGSEGQYMWGWNKPFYYCVKTNNDGILIEERFAYTPMKGYLCWKIPAATISAFNGAVIDRGEDGTKYKLVSVVNNTARYRAFDTPLNISDYTTEVNGGYGYIADSSNSRLRLNGNFNTLLLDGYDDNWGISWDWFYYIAYALMRATLGCADVQSTSAPLTPVTSGYDVVQNPNAEKSLHPGLMSLTGAPSSNSDWQSRFRCHCLYPTSTGIGEGAGDITGNITFNGPDGASYGTAVFYGWKNPYGHMPYIKYGHKLLFLNNEKMAVNTLNNKGVSISSKPIPNPITPAQVANGYTITGLSTEGLMGYPGSVGATGLNTFYGDSITANNSVVGGTAFINNVPVLIATEISDLKAGMASVHLIKESDRTVNTEKYGSVLYTIALCESDEPFNYEPIQY